MPGMEDFLARKYAILQQQADPAGTRADGIGVGLEALGREQARADRVAVDPFSGMKAGETRGFRSWNANQVDVPGSATGMTVIGGTGSRIGDAQSLRYQGWDPKDAIALSLGSAQAGTTGLLAQAAARRDNTESDLRPAESAALIAEQRARAALTGETTRWYGPEAQARIGNINAQTGYTRTQDQELQQRELHNFGPMGDNPYSQYRPKRRTVVAPLRTSRSVLDDALSVRLSDF